jgi:hypothetical protein
MKKLWDGISAAFATDEGARDYAKEYLAELRTNWREAEKSITRLSTLILALAAVFELVQSSKVGELTLLGVKLSTNNVIRFALPVVIAYLYYALALSFVDADMFCDGHDAVIGKVWPTMHDNEVYGLLYPANSFNGTVTRIDYLLTSDDRAVRWGDLIAIIRPVVMVLAPPLFLIAAYVQLFDRYGVHSALLWVSAGLSPAISALGVGTFNIWLKKTPSGPDY